jgi:hypothetical protein
MKAFARHIKFIFRNVGTSMMNKQVRKHLNASSLLATMKQAFEKIPDPLAGRTNYPLADCFMAGLAMFGLKYRSLLQFDEVTDVTR